jgi:hypothetical protein
MKANIGASATRHHMHQPRRMAHHPRPSHQRMGESMRTILVILLASIAYFAWYPYLLTQNPLV